MAKRKKLAVPVTAAEWQTSDDAARLVAFARTLPRSSPRVWRLYLAAFWRWQVQHVAPPDREGTIRRAGYLSEWAETGKRPAELTDAEYDRYIYFSRSPAVGATRTARSRTPEGRERLRFLLHEVFGDPFAPAPFDLAWRTSTAVALAQGIYDDRAFDRMPILADALQDAGCHNEALLAHLRDEAREHVRGCWAVDLVLGKA